MHNRKSYEFYEALSRSVPAYMLAVILGISFILSSLLVQCCCYRLCELPLLDNIAARMNKFFMVEFTDKSETNEEESFFLYGVEVRDCLIYYLFLIFLTIIGASFILFWNTFITDEFYGCDSGWDCFPLHVSNNTPIQSEPITENCTDYINNENVTVLCYKLALKYSEGIGDGGGFMFAMQVMVNILVYATVGTQNSTCCKRCCNKCCYITIIMITVWLLQLTITIALPLGLYANRLDVRETLDTPQRKFQFATYMCMNFILLPLVPTIGIQYWSNKITTRY